MGPAAALKTLHVVALRLYIIETALFGLLEHIGRSEKIIMNFHTSSQGGLDAGAYIMIS